MNIINFEVKNNLKTTIIWIIAICFIGLLYTAMGPVFIDQSETLIEFMSGMGEEFLNGLGINFDTFFTPAGFFSYIGGFIAMALCIQAMIYGIRAFALEKNNKSSEFLYTKPKSRIKIFSAKYMANIILLSITQIIVITVIYYATDVINTVSYDHSLFLMLLITFIPLQYMFFTLGTVIGTVANRVKSIVPITMGFGIGMFFLNMLGGIVDSEIIGYLSFFNYYNLSNITLNEEYDMVFVAISIALIVLFTITSLTIFKRKDMKVL